ncbi:phosphoribosylamine--glycine ligase [Nosocomiicoccus sp. HMSC067E10]|uniref:phosphoribosylamine--glycine ligase n=1 Tax=Nosocomiicoccus sp. HMSC067E10 TaxID=1739271 RepID=UPI0008A193CC|nr:phosphoribosylamine--glycine ligase [Nosocomiicoccus sp. HMSC067E10]OFL49322.1 phosphoribosylamine--glycine ligase [Nosocomiicoccus sp. HMSC067E10]
MNVAVIGSGGREHAIVKMLADSKVADKIIAIPGNAGMNDICEVMYRVDPNDFDAIAGICIERQIDWVIIGPPEPLEKGLADFLIDEYGLTVFGPRKHEAQIETSKIFTKQLLNKYNIPTADYKIFTNYNEAKNYLTEADYPIVIKHDGLGDNTKVVVAQSQDEAYEALDYIAQFKGEDTPKIEPIIIEEYLDGEEFSLMVLVNEDVFHPFEIIAQDHKSAYKRGVGPNTDGMGAYAPITHLDDSVRQEAIDTLVKPTVDAMVKEGMKYFGVLFLGAMHTADGVKVLEYNARFGDPEAQVLMSMLENDFLNMLEKLKRKESFEMKWKKGFMAGAVLATKDYPYKENVGLELDFPESLKEYMYISGLSQKEDGSYISSKGRVLMVCNHGNTIEEALNKVNKHMKQIKYNDGDFYYREDIGHRALNSSKEKGEQ